MIFKLPVLFLFLVLITSSSWKYDLHLEQKSTTLLLIIVISFFGLLLYKKQFLCILIGILLFGIIFYGNNSIQYSENIYKKEEVYVICKLSTNTKSIILKGNSNRFFFCKPVSFIHNSFKADIKETYLIYDNKMIKEENIIFIKGVLHFSNNKNDVNLLFPYKVKYQNKNEAFSTMFFHNLDFSEVSYSFLKAFILGIKSELDTDHKKIFINSGTMHLFAVSGLHMGCLYAAFISVFKILGSTRNLSMVMTMFILLGYLYLVNFSVSSTRAYLMLCIWVVSKLLGVKVNNFHVVAMAGLSMLLYNAGTFLDIGFILSIGVVLSIVWYLESMKEITLKRNRLVVLLFNVIKVNYSAFWGSFLVLAKCFGLIVPVSLLSNLLIIPLVSIMMPLSILSLLVLNLVDFSLLVYSLDFFILYLIKICSFFSNLPWSTFEWETTTKVQFSDFYLFLSFLIISYGRIRNQWLRFFALPILAITLLFF